MTTTFSRSLSTHFPNGLNSTQLRTEIINNGGISQSIHRIDSGNPTADDVVIEFVAGLTVGEGSILDTIISNHNPDPPIFSELIFETVTDAQSPFKTNRKSINCDTTNGNITIKLQKASRAVNGIIAFKKISADNTVTIDPHGSELIDGQSTKTLTALNERLVIDSDGTKWNLCTCESIEGNQINQSLLPITSHKGSTYIDDGNRVTELMVGNDGEIIVADSAADVGVKYGTISDISGFIDWTADASANNIHDNNIPASNVTQHENLINHNNLSGYVAKQHLDWTTDRGANNIHQNNITQGSITQHESAVNINNLLNAPTGTVVGTTDAQTLTNKTLNSPTLNNPVISTISNTGTVTLPTSTDTLVGRNTIDTFQNKTWGDNLNMDSNKITNLATPTQNTDAATKLYVDNVAQGIQAKDSVRAKTVSTLPSYAQSGAGVGATLIATSNGTLPAIDGVILENGDRLLVDTEGSAADSDNGIYVVTDKGSASSQWVLTRATDADNEITSGLFTFVTEGITSANNGYILTTNNPITVDTTPLSFTQFSGAGQIDPGTGLTKTGDTLNVEGSSTIIANADNLEVNSSNIPNQVLLSSGTVGTAPTYSALPLSNANAVTGTLPVNRGGTGATTFSSGNFLQGNGTSAVITTKAVPSGDVVGTSDYQLITNKIINSANNTMNIAASVITSGTLSDARVSASNVTQHEGSININNLSGAPAGSVVGTTGSQTLQEKTFIDSTTLFADNADNTKKVRFEVSGVTTGNTRVLTAPNENTTLVGTDATQTLTNKTINSATNTLSIAATDITSGTIPNSRIGSTSITQHESSVNINNLSGAPAGSVVGTTDSQTLTNKTISSASNTISISTADITSGTLNNSRVSVQNITQHENSININNLSGAPAGSVVGATDAQTLTNKTIDSTSNTVTADKLRTTTGTVVISTAAAPSTGDVLTATSATTAGWAAPAGGSPETVGYFHAYTSATGSNFTTTPTIVNFNTVVKSHADWSLASGVATAQTSDDFLFIVDVGTEGSSGTSRSGSDAYIEADTGGGYAELTGTRALMYNRGSAYGDNSASICRPITVTTGDKFRVMTVRHHGSDTLKTRANSCRITIIKIKGERGLQGVAGADGDMTWQGEWTSQNYLKNQCVEYNGSAYVCNTNTVANNVPTDTNYWDLLASKGDQGIQGIQGIQGPTGLIDWQGEWTSQNYTVGQSVSYNGESFICKLNTVSSENPSNTTFWDKMAEKGATGTAGSGSTINVLGGGAAVKGSPFEKINFIGTTKTEKDTGDTTMVNIYTGISHYGALAADPSGTFNAGDKYFNTVLNEEMFYDASRSKWLSVAIRFEGSGLNGSAGSGTFYRRFNGMSLSLTTGPYVRKGTIVEISFGTSNAVNHTYEILVGGVTVAELASGGATEAATTKINADFNAGKMSSRNKSGSSTTTFFQGTVGYRLRA